MLDEKFEKYHKKNLKAITGHLFDITESVGKVIEDHENRIKILEKKVI